MSNQDKNKPLSAEELFKLLEDKSNKVNDFEDMDDFEKEALEGFTAHSTSQKAKYLTDELNSAISKRVEESENRGGVKNRIIWFSSAASIAVIIFVSIFFFNQSNQDSENNIALNETSKKEIILLDVSSIQEASGVTEINLETKETNNTASSTTQEQDRPLQKKSLESAIHGPDAYKQALAENAKDISKIDDLKNTNETDEDAMQKESIVLSDKLEAKKNEQTNREESQIANDNSIGQNASTISTANNKKNTLNKNEDFDKLAEEKSTRASVKKDKSAGNTNADIASKSAPADASTVVNNNSAYYTGGELAIKEFVILYFKSKHYYIPIIGKYKITGAVLTSGNLKVNSIMQVSNENCKCTEKITEALNTMTKWNPSMRDGIKIQSDVEFVIGF